MLEKPNDGTVAFYYGDVVDDGDILSAEDYLPTLPNTVSLLLKISICSLQLKISICSATTLFLLFELIRDCLSPVKWGKLTYCSEY